MNAHYFLSAFAIYIALLIGIGWFFSRRNRSGDDFLLAGRGLPVFLTIGTTVATMVGTGSSMGAVGFGYANGWSGALYGIGGAAGILLLGLLFAPARAQRFSTMSEELASYVGDHPLVKKTVAVLILLACLGWLGAHILGGSLYLSWISGIELQWAKLMVALGFGVFVVIGGYHAVVWTDTLQAIVLFIGFLLMAVFAIDQVGGLNAMIDAHSSARISPQTATSESARLLPGISLAAVIAVGVLATPSFRQRIYSGRTVQSVRRSFYVSGGIYLFFSLVPAIIGICAFLLNPGLENRNFAFPYLALEVLPLGIGVLVLLAGLSATMSSASSDAIAGVSVLVRDMRAPAVAETVAQSRIGLLLVIGTALALALLSDDLIGYISTMISTVMSGLFVCGLLGRFWPGFRWQGALAAIATGSVTSLIVMLWFNDFWGNPVLPAVVASLLMGWLVSVATAPVATSTEGSDPRAELDAH